MVGHRAFFSEEENEMVLEFKRRLEDILFEKRIKIKEAAKRLGISSERMYKYLNPGSNNQFPASLLALWTRIIGPELLSWIAHEAGYAIAKLPEGEVGLKDAVKVASKAMKECSEALEAFSKAVEDGKVTQEEWEKVKKEVREALSALFALEKIAGGMRG